MLLYVDFDSSVVKGKLGSLFDMVFSISSTSNPSSIEAKNLII